PCYPFPLCSSFLFLMLPPPPRSPLFPYTTLFRSPNTIRVVDLHGFTLTRERVHDVALHPNHDLLLTVRPSLACSDSTSRARLKRSEEHTSELQSRFDLVCRLLLEKKKITESGHKE